MRLPTPLQCLLGTALLLGASHSLAQSRLLADLTTGSASSFLTAAYGAVMEAEHIGGKYYVAVGCRIFRYEGVGTSASPVVELPGSGCGLKILGRLGDRFVFTRNSVELWSSDGSPGGAVQLPVSITDPVNDRIGGFYHWPRFPGWMLVLVDKFGTRIDEVWLTDGSIANTRMIQATGSNASVTFLRNGRAALLGSGLWTLVNPSANAVNVSTAFTSGNALFSGTGDAATETDRRVYFTANTVAAGTELWSSDLTPGGTTLLLDHTAGPTSTSLQWAGTPAGDGSYYFIVDDQLFRTTPGTGTSTKINPVGTIVVRTDNLRVAPVQAIDNDVMLVRITENSGRRIWKLRDSVPGSFAPASQSPVFGLSRAMMNWFVRWPDRALYGPNAVEGGVTGAYAAQAVPSPLDAAITSLTAPAAGPERAELRGDQYLQWSAFGNANRWRRNATTRESVPLFPAGNDDPSTYFARPGGSLALFVHPSPTTGLEPHGLDLLPSDVPMCNRPALKVLDNSAAQDSIVVYPNRLSAADRVLDLRVYLKARHSFVGDLRVMVEHVPSGRSAVLLDRPGVPQTGLGCNGDDLDVLFDDAASTSVETCASMQAYGPLVSLRPEQPLSALVGIDPVGEWKLTISDASGGDIGGVVEWCLDMTAGTLSDDVFRNGFENIPVGP